MAGKKSDKSKAAPKTDEIMSYDQLISMFTTRFGEGAAFRFDDDTNAVSVYPIPTGIPTIDYASGIGGFPLGRVVEIYGPESSGKTSLSLMAIAQAQRISRDISDSPIYQRKVLYIDAENALDKAHMKNLGCDLSNIIISQPDYAEQALDMVEAACISKQFSVIVVDSVPALLPKKVVESSNEDDTMGLLAKKLSTALPKIAKPANEANTLVIFINQVRDKLGAFSSYGTPETTPGGRALKFYASMRLDIRRKELKQGDVSIGQSTTVRFKKNKLSSPFTVGEYDYLWVGGVDIIKSVVEVASSLDVIKRAGAWYYIGEDVKNPSVDGNGNQLKWQGKDNVTAVIRNSPALYHYINDIVQGKIPKDALFVTEDLSPEESDDLEEVGTSDYPEQEALV